VAEVNGSALVPAFATVLSVPVPLEPLPDSGADTVTLTVELPPFARDEPPVALPPPTAVEVEPLDVLAVLFTPMLLTLEPLPSALDVEPDVEVEPEPEVEFEVWA
jgi:hypothetical protein